MQSLFMNADNDDSNRTAPDEQVDLSLRLVILSEGTCSHAEAHIRMVLYCILNQIFLLFPSHDGNPE